VDFETGENKYSIKDANGVIISHPIRKGPNTYVVNFAADSRLSSVNISSTNFADDTVGFDYLGSPYNGDDSHLNSTGEIVLSAGGSTMTVNVEPVTGYITITD